MGKALYREYRPKKLSEVVGQEHVTATLTNALNLGRISHAYLLTGPRGVGKTSIARILAHEINKLPYGEESHLDIIEIDAASNRRIDEIRDLRDKVHVAPASAPYKVYIIDEVHMLTKEAFNALLKTLEEPPEHVVFILATTEAHKLPETIISRTQRYTFRPVPQEQVVDLLKNIAQKESIDIDDAALKLIAVHGEGSLRDSTSLLDQAGNNGGKVEKSDIERMLGLASAEHIDALQAAVSSGNTTQIVTSLTELFANGHEPAIIAQQLGAQLRQSVLSGKSGKEIFPLLKQLLEVPASRAPRQYLELTLLQFTVPLLVDPSQTIAPHSISPSTNKPTPASAVEPKVTEAASSTQKHTVVKPTEALEPEKKPEQLEGSDQAEDPLIEAATEAPKPTDTPKVPKPQGVELSEVELNDLWQQTLDTIKKQYNTLYGIARMATPELHEDTLTLNLKFAFHQKRISEAKNRKILSDVFSEVSNRTVEIYCVVADKPLPKLATPASGNDVSAISNIFGGAELIES